MKCPFCGTILKVDEENEGFLLCYGCHRRLDEAQVEAYWADDDEESNVETEDITASVMKMPEHKYEEADETIETPAATTPSKISKPRTVKVPAPEAVPEPKEEEHFVLEPDNDVAPRNEPKKDLPQLSSPEKSAFDGLETKSSQSSKSISGEIRKADPNRHSRTQAQKTYREEDAPAPAESKEKKSKTPLIIGIIAGIVLLAAIGVGAFFILGNNSNTNTNFAPPANEANNAANNNVSAQAGNDNSNANANAAPANGSAPAWASMKFWMSGECYELGKFTLKEFQEKTGYRVDLSGTNFGAAALVKGGSKLSGLTLRHPESDNVIQATVDNRTVAECNAEDCEVIKVSVSVTEKLDGYPDFVLTDKTISLGGDASGIEDKLGTPSETNTNRDGTRTLKYEYDDPVTKDYDQLTIKISTDDKIQSIEYYRQ